MSDHRSKPTHQVFAPRRLRALKPGSDEAALARAQNRFDDLQENFHGWIMDELAKLLQALDTFVDRPEQGTLAVLRRAARDFEANAIQLGYPIASRIAASLARLLDGGFSGPGAGGLAQGHGQAIASIIRSGPNESQNATALALAEALELAVGQRAARPA